MATAIDLFCGAGGLSTGLLNVGFQITGALDSWDVAVKTYALNFNHPVVHANIVDLSIDEFWRRIGCSPCPIDLVAGGPPCQGFSVQRIGKDQDDRNDLILEFARFVLAIRPKMFLMENVPGLLGKRGSHIAIQFETLLYKGGYKVQYEQVNTAEYGTPQIRRRVFYYGWLASNIMPFSFPKPTHTANTFLSVWDVIGDLPSPPMDYTPLPTDHLHRRTHLSQINLERLRQVPPGGGFENLPVHLRVDAHKNGAEKIGHRYVYGRLAPDKPAGTITGRFDSFTRGKFAHPYEDRNITLREGARLQTFDDKFHFLGTQEEIAALIGNAIPPRVAEIIGKAILEHLKKTEDEGFSISETSGSIQPKQLSLFEFPMEV